MLILCLLVMLFVILLVFLFCVTMARCQFLVSTYLLRCCLVISAWYQLHYYSYPVILLTLSLFLCYQSSCTTLLHCCSSQCHSSHYCSSHCCSSTSCSIRIGPFATFLSHHSSRGVVLLELLFFLHCFFHLLVPLTLSFPSCCSFHIVILLMFQVLSSQPLFFFLCCCYFSCAVANPLTLLMFCFAWLICYFPCPCHVQVGAQNFDTDSSTKGELLHIFHFFHCFFCFLLLLFLQFCYYIFSIHFVFLKIMYQYFNSCALLFCFLGFFKLKT